MIKEFDVKISIVVPIYNVAEYLDRCILSLVNQSHKRLEIILVDDGSQDESPGICDAWQTKDERIKVIHKKNGGLSDARNVGIEASIGDYLLLVDSDDYIAGSMCEVLLKAALQNNADMALCGLYWEYGDHREQEHLSVPNGSVIERENILETWAQKQSIEFVVAWNKLYRRSLFFSSEHIRYPVGRIHEDEFTTYQLLYAANRVVFVDDPLYFYTQRAGSIMSCYSERNLQDFAAAVESYCNWSRKYAPEKHKLMEHITWRGIHEILRKVSANPKLKNGQEIYMRMRKYAKQEINDYMNNPYANIREKLNYVVFKSGLYIKLYKLLVGSH